MSNIDKLKDGGVILNADQVPPEDRKKIESLSPQEIDTLIRIRHKIGDDFGKHAKPGTYNNWKMRVNF